MNVCFFDRFFAVPPAGQQLDFPNVWPPVDWMLIDGAERFGGKPGDALARSVSCRADAAAATTGRRWVACQA